MHKLLTYLFYQLVLVTVLIAYYLVMSQVPINHDTAWYFVATQKWMNGAKLYIDIMEVNPPWSFYCTIPGIYLAKFLDTSVANGFTLSILLLTWLSFTVTQVVILKIAKRHPLQNVLLLFGSLVIVIIVSLNQFGQREHIFVLCVLPYLFFVYAELKGSVFSKSSKIFLAILSSIGILLKPYFVFLPLLIGLISALSSREIKNLFKIEYMTMASACVAYVAFVYIVHSEYFSFLLPYAVDTYDEFKFSDAKVRETLPFTLIYFIVFTTIILMLFSPTLKAASYFGVASIGGVIIYYLQSKGFSYHGYPFYIFSWIFLLIVFIDGIESEKRWLLIVGLLGIVLFFNHSNKIKFYKESFASQKLGEEIEKYNKDHISVISLTTNVSAAFPLLSAPNRVWASRFPTQWFLPGALNSLSTLDCTEIDNIERCKRNHEILDYMRDANLEDMKIHSPDVIAFDVRAFEKYSLGNMDEEMMCLCSWKNYADTINSAQNMY